MISLIALCVLESLSILFGCLYTSSLYYEEVVESKSINPKTSTEQVNVGKKIDDYYILYALILGFIMVMSQLLVLRLSILAQQRFCDLHAYLMNYKMSPTSRIFKRHKPQMEAVYEVPSAYERSESLPTV